MISWAGGFACQRRASRDFSRDSISPHKRKANHLKTGRIVDGSRIRRAAYPTFLIFRSETPAKI
jgi:hypothetical protein